MATFQASHRRDHIVGGVRISHPDRLIYPQLDISKIQLARYFERIGWPGIRALMRVMEVRSAER